MKKQEELFKDFKKNALTYKIVRACFSAATILGCIVLFVLSLVTLNKLYMALCFELIAVYSIIRIISVKVDERMDWDFYDMAISITGAVIAVIGSLICFNIFPFLKHIFNFVATFIINLLIYSSTADLSYHDILDWTSTEGVYEAGVVFAIVLIVVLLLPILDFKRVLDYSENDERCYQVYMDRKKNVKSDNAFKSASFKSEKSDTQNKKVVARPRKEIKEDLLDSCVGSAEASSIDLDRPMLNEKDKE